MVEDSHEVGDTLLDYDRKRNSREQRGSDSVHQRFGHILACQAGERLSSSVVVGNVVRNDGLFHTLGKHASISDERRNHT